MMYRAFGAKLLETEMEIEYWPEDSKKTDFTCNIWGNRVAVSVTRAMKFPAGVSTFSSEDAKSLLLKKLNGVMVSNKNVTKRHAWRKQILHIFAESQKTMAVLRSEFNKLPQMIKSNVIIIMSDATNAPWIFMSWPPRLKYQCL